MNNDLFTPPGSFTNGAEDHGAEHHVFYLFIYGAQDLGPEHHGAGKSSPRRTGTVCDGPCFL